MIDPNYLAQLEQQNGLPPGLLMRQMMAESSGNPNAVSPRGAVGAFQFMPATAQQYGIDPRDENQSAQGAVRMDSDLMKKYNGNVPMALAGYNWGQGNVDRKGMQNAPPETQSYIQKIMGGIGNAIAPSAQAADNSSLPQGFTLDNQQASNLPAGFTLDQKDAPGIFETATNAMKDTATFGLGSVAAGLGAGAANLIKGGSFGEGYDKERQDYANKLDAGAQANPTASAIGSTLGAVGSIPFNAAAALPQAATRLGRFGQFVKNNTLVGGVAGGAGAFGNTQGDVGQQLSAVPGGIAAGAALGTVVPFGTKVVSSVATPIAKGIMNIFGSNADNIIDAKLTQAMENAGMTSQDVMQKLNEMGPNATITDALGEAGRKAIRPLQGKPGPASTDITDFLEQRQAGQQGRIGDQLNQNLGGSDNFYDAMDNLEQQRIKQSAPLYKDAFAANKSMTSPVIDKILNTNFGQSALSGAADRMNTKMALMAVPDKELTEQAADAGLAVKNGVASGLKLQTLDIIKQEMDDQINAAIKQVGNGSMRKSQLGDMISMKNALVDEMDRLDVTAKAGPNSLKPEGGLYAQGRAAYAGPSQSRNAMEMGRQFMQEDPEINMKAINKLNQSDKEFFRLGAQRQALEMIQSAPEGGNAVNKLLGNTNKLKALQSIWPDKQSFDQFVQNMKSESEFYKTNQIRFGSPTEPRMRETEAFNITAPKEALLSKAKELLQTAGEGKLSKEGEQLMATRMLSTNKMQNFTYLNNLAQKQSRAEQVMNAKQQGMRSLAAQVGRKGGQ